jgi:hypothetical protein
MEDEVDEHAYVHDEDEEQYDYPSSGSTGLSTRCVLLGFEGGVEVLCLEFVERGVCVVLSPWSV